jgi:FkbM family methyltransferase
VLARVVKLALDSVPGPVVDKLRTIPVLAPLLRRVLGAVSRPLHGRAVAVGAGPAKGLLLTFDETSAVWASGKTELDVQEAFARLVRPGFILFDIGANIGFFTLLGARLVGPSGTVVAFEPHPENCKRLRRNVELNRFSNVVIVEQAVSDASGSRLLDTSNPATASLVDVGPYGAEGLVRVEATSLDDYLEPQPRLGPDIVKIDAEGHEVEIVRGMGATLKRTTPVLICELHHRSEEFAAAVELVGYQIASLAGVDRIERPPPLGHVLAVPAGHQSRAGRSGA